MNTLSSHEERDLVSAIEQSIRLTHDGMSPNDAITKIASDRQYNPPKIRRMVEAFNKSKSVHVFKTASDDDRAKAFDIADSHTVIGNIYSPQEKTASAFQLPQPGLFDIEFSPNSKALLDKVASMRDPAPVDQATFDRLYKQASLEQEQIQGRMEKEAHDEVQTHRYAFERSLSDLCDYFAPLSRRNLNKEGQRIFNGYPESAPRLLGLIEHHARVKFPEFTKTANAVIFPVKEPYLTITRLYDAADNMARAEVQLQMVKEGAGDGFTGNFAANALANWMAGAGADPRQLAGLMASKKKSRSVEEDLDPQYFNRMKGHDAKRNFMLKALYDPDLKEYDISELRKAYNQAVSLNPEAYRNPEVLKQALITNLNSSGVKDSFEVKQELEIGKLMAKQRKDSEDSLAREKALKEMRDQEGPAPGPVDLGLGFSPASGLKRLRGEIKEHSQKSDAAKAKAKTDQKTQSMLAGLKADLKAALSNNPPSPRYRDQPCAYPSACGRRTRRRSCPQPGSKSSSGRWRNSSSRTDPSDPSGRYRRRRCPDPSDPSGTDSPDSPRSWPTGSHPYARPTGSPDSPIPRQHVLTRRSYH